MKKSDSKIFRHHSYGKISVGKVVGGNGYHFGSKIRTNENIRLTLSGAEVLLENTGEYYHDTNEIIEITLTPNQWAELISIGMNTSGVPCTINRMEGKSIQYKVPFDFVDETEQRIKGKLEGLEEKTKNALIKADEIINNKKTPSKKDVKELRDLMYFVNMEVESNFTFYLKRFGEEMQKVVTDAKSELMNFSVREKVKNTIKILGGK